MANFDNKFETTKNDWETPDDLFDELHKEFHFTLDAAADVTNTKTPRFISSEEDGLSQHWGTNTVWVNPPYGDRSSKLKDWVQKGLNAARQGATVVMLIPARTNTNWFHDLCLKHGEIRFVRGRPKFKGCKHGLPWPLCFVIFRPDNES